MATYGFDDMACSVDCGAGTPREMKTYIDGMSNFEVGAVLVDGHTMGDSWVEKLYTGLKEGKPVTLTGVYDDTATTGPNAVFIGVGDTRTLLFTWGGSKTSSMEAIISNYKRIPAKGDLTRFEVELIPTGTVTEA